MREELDIPMPSMGPSYRVSRKPPGMDPNTRRLAIIAGGIGGLLLLLVGIWSVAGQHRGGVPVIDAQAGPMRVKLENPGGLQVVGENESIMGGSTGSNAPGGQATLAAAPEVPALQALKAQEQQAAAPAAAAPVMPALPVAARVEAMKPAAATPAPIRLAAARPAARIAPAPPGHGPQVQLAALDSEQGAMLEWQRLTRRAPAMFSGRKPSVMRVEHDGHVFWRLRTSGFVDAAQAGAFCARLKATRAGCEVTRF